MVSTIQEEVIIQASIAARLTRLDTEGAEEVVPHTVTGLSC
jgi:hypothetical protein